GNGRPQAGEQEATRDDREHRGGHCARRPAVQRGHRPTNECGSADEPQDGEAHAWPAASEGREEPAHNTPTPAYGIDSARATLKRGAPDTLSSRQASVPMMPRFSPMRAACVRSFAPSFERMILTRLLTVSSEIDSCAAICLLALPPAISRSTSISAVVRASCIACSASWNDASGDSAFLPAWTLRIVSSSSLSTSVFRRYARAPACRARSTWTSPT